MGKGDKIPFWLDLWAGNRTLSDTFPNLYNHESDKRCYVSDRYRTNQGGIQWFWGSRNNLSSNALLKEWDECLAVINEVTISQRSDAWLWRMGEKQVEFQARLVRAELDEISLINETTVLIWLHWIPKKVNCFLWRVVLDRIATKEALQILRIHLPSVNCVLCNEEIESVNHLLVTCGLAQQIWAVIFQWMKIPLPRYILSVVQLLEFTDSYQGIKKYKRAVYTAVATTCWIIWKTRNDVIFKSKPPVLAKIIGDIKVVSFSWVCNRSELKDFPWEKWRSFRMRE
ncbi:uncharacterized protein LOC110932129 [Helianthus annuus]|uniref:uncharacterized protein LOC110932129 n=1 Tax=Helianthus annuus TaxID=4232 RepID=UPI000B8F58AB|nr:uncharacterized protein LOC110932129 [Helianthus annuus]